MSFDFPFASEELDFGFISTQISQMIHSALMNRGPVHLNIMFKEPFFGIMKESAIKTSYPPLQFCLPHLEANPSDMKTLSKKVGEKGLIIIGSDLDEIDLLAIAKLSHHLGYPVLPEIPSNFHLVESPFISHIELIIKGSLPHSLIPDHILFFGHRLISKTLLEWIKKISLSTFVQIAPETSYYNPIHRLTHKFTCSIASFCNQLIHYKAENEELDFSSGWHTLSQCYENAFTSYPKESVEWQFFREISHEIKGHPLFIANSMPIRFMNNFYNSKVQFGKTHVNRGTSGIDGNIGTSIGLCAGYQKPLVSLIGDQTALHDMNSLNLLKETKGHHLVIVNNSGGNIFSHLPIGKHKGPFEKFFFAGHGYSFKPLAEMFQIPYHPVYSLEELSFEGESSLTEIIVSAQEGNKSYEAMLQKVISEVEDELSCLPSMG
jgi:2-succinyl-5-enolpyruvyl-6-hydroxy-3-cyclohexene-1-carboxylate synthase